jgi:phosphoribosyl-AMP cyclohydrolase
MARRPQFWGWRVFCFGANMQLDFQKMGGLIPAVVQDAATGEVLMVGFMNEEALRETLTTGNTTFFSRSRNKLWHKGETSGHTLKLRQALVDCDADTLLIRVEPTGPGACHEGYLSCFFRELEADGAAKVIAERAFDPAAVYGGGR